MSDNGRRGVEGGDALIGTIVFLYPSLGLRGLSLLAQERLFEIETPEANRDERGARE